jgi:hypothetical protein
MRKRYIWAIKDGLLYRFRHKLDREEWVEAQEGDVWLVDALHPDVKRVNRRLSSGEQISFPIKIEEV